MIREPSIIGGETKILVGVIGFAITATVVLNTGVDGLAAACALGTVWRSRPSFANSRSSEVTCNG